MEHYPNHIATLQNHLNEFLDAEKAPALLLGSGDTHFFFDDDIELPHRIPATLSHWIPEDIGAQQYLLLTKESRILFSFRPQDFWLNVKKDYGPWAEQFSLQTFSDLDALYTALNHALPAGSLWFGPDQPEILKVNAISQPQKQAIDSWRLIKSPFEIKQLFTASCLAAQAHVALKESFEEGVSEFEAHLDYLDILRYVENDLPYGNIVAFNHNASILHYQDLQREPPEFFYSFLLDAGAKHLGYIADISRTHAGADANELFQTLLSSLRAIKLVLIDFCIEGRSYIDVHQEAVRLIATCLINHNILIHCSVEAAMTKGFARVFFPHGIGHLLGLNTHDTRSIAKSLTDAALPFKTLRLTHHLKNNMVLTIEPGIYFNPLLINQAKGNPEQAPHLNLALIETLIPYGGIRDEDNIVINGTTPRNLTAEAFAAIGFEGF